MKGAANIALSEKSVLDHQIGKSMTELITRGESFFTMEGCSLSRQLLINSRSGRLNFLLKLFFLQIQKMSLSIGKGGSALNFSGKRV